MRVGARVTQDGALGQKSHKSTFIPGVHQKRVFKNFFLKIFTFK